MVTHDDDLEQNPEWDAKALRLVETIERAIVRLRLESQGEFVAIINAIEVQLESKHTAPDVLRLLVESLRALARVRTLEQHHQARLDQRLNELLDRVSPGSR